MSVNKQRDVEMTVIAHLFANEQDLAFIQLQQVTPEFFTHQENGKPIFRGLFVIAFDYYTRYGKLLTQAGLEMMLKEDYELEPGSVQYDRMLAAFIEISSKRTDTDSLPAYVHRLREAVMARKLSEIMSVASESLKTKGPIRAFEDVRNSILDVQFDLNGTQGTRIFNLATSAGDIWNEYLLREKYPDRYKGIEVGLTVLDEATFGFKRGSLNIVIGEVGKGKSTILLNWAAEVFRRGYNVIFFSFEMPLWQVQARLVAREAMVSYEQFQKGKLTGEQKARLQAAFEEGNKGQFYRSRENGNYFLIVQEADDCTVPFVESVIKKHQVLGPPDAVFCDYLGNMTSREVLQSRGKSYEHSGRCAMDLRKLAKIYNFASFTAQQLNREGLSKGRKEIEDNPEEFEPHSEHVAGSKEAINVADSAIVFSPNPDEKKMYFKKMKGRDFDFEPFFATYYPEMCLIYDDNDDTQQTATFASISGMDHVRHQMATVTGSDGDAFDADLFGE